jgi:hypothetical protein
VSRCPTSSCSSCAMRCRSASWTASSQTLRAARSASSRSRRSLKLWASRAATPPPRLACLESVEKLNQVVQRRQRAVKQRGVGGHNDGEAGCQHGELRGGHLMRDGGGCYHQWGEGGRKDRSVDQADPSHTTAGWRPSSAPTLFHGFSPVHGSAHALARKWVADPILHGGVAGPHWMCNGRWTPPYTDQAVHAETPLDERRPANAEENWSHWDRTFPSSARRASHAARSHRDPGTDEPAIRPARASSRRAGPGLGNWRRVGAPATKTPIGRKRIRDFAGNGSCGVGIPSR